MICPNCKKSIVDNAVMCPYCNTFVDKRYLGNTPQNTTSGTNNYTVRRTSATSGAPKRKKSALLLTSAILGVLYAVYSIFYWSGATSGASSAAYAIGAGIATALVMPHLICSVLAAIFNVLGWAMNSRGFALTGAILYAVAMVMFPIYAMFVIIQMILSFVGFARLKKLNEN